MPVGIYYKGERNFSNQIINIQEGDSVYLFSDGYVDQFGGEDGRKFMIKRFGELILKIHENPMPVQKELLNDVIVKWQLHKNDKNEIYRQIDDILVVGFRI